MFTMEQTNKRRKSDPTKGTPKCHTCGILENKMKHWGPEIILKKCICRKVSYCSYECQLSDWKGHKEECRDTDRRTALKNAGQENLQALFEIEWVLATIEELLPSLKNSATDKELLHEARKIVDMLHRLDPVVENRFFASLLFQRLMKNGRASFRALQGARHEIERIRILCQDVMNVWIGTDGHLFGGRRFESLTLDNADEGVSSCQAIVDLLRTFPAEQNGEDTIYPIAFSMGSQEAFCDTSYSKKRCALYLDSNWINHLRLLQNLCERVIRAPETHIAWVNGCMSLMHLLVACISYSELAKVVLRGANQALIDHEGNSTKAGFKEYFSPLLVLFQLCRTADCDAMLHLLHQLAALLVTQSGKAQQLMELAGDMHTQYLEHLFLSQFNGDQFKRWTDHYIPWAETTVKLRAD